MNWGIINFIEYFVIIMSCRLELLCKQITSKWNWNWEFSWNTCILRLIFHLRYSSLKKTVQSRWFRDIKHSLCILTITKFLFCKGRKYSVDFSPSSNHSAYGLCIMSPVFKSLFSSDGSEDILSSCYLGLLIVIPLLSYFFGIYFEYLTTNPRI